MRVVGQHLRASIISCSLQRLCARDTAILDRYTAIWRFFRSEASSRSALSPTKAVSSTRVPVYSRGRGIGGCQVYRRTLLGIRSLNTSRPRFEGKGLESPKPASDGKLQDGEKGKGKDDSSSAPVQDPYKHLENYSRFFRRLAMSLPPMQRPTRDDLLNVATSFWQRLQIRFKWVTIRSFRKFTVDEVFAFFTWFLMSQTVWILVGT